MWCLRLVRVQYPSVVYRPPGEAWTHLIARGGKSTVAKREGSSFRDKGGERCLAVFKEDGTTHCCAVDMRGAAV